MMKIRTLGLHTGSGFWFGAEMQGEEGVRTNYLKACGGRRDKLREKL